ALVASGSTLAKVPLFLLAIYLIRGVPAMLYRPLIGLRLTFAAAALQATTLSFVLIASQIGEQLGLINADTAPALTAAALASVLINPVIAISLLQSPTPTPAGGFDGRPAVGSS